MTRSTQSWVEEAVEIACAKAGDWYKSLPQFTDRVNLKSVVGFKHPALLSEQDCVVNFARFLHEAGIEWDAIHFEVSVSRWLFEAPHPAATSGGPGWRADIALIREEDLLAARLPATESAFAFEACLEFAYLSDFWSVPGATPWGHPAKGRDKVSADVEKIARYLRNGVCKAGYVIVFEECDSGFPASYAADAEAESGCRVRFVRGY